MSSELIKLYYRIGEVSSIVGVQPHVLRYWESEFRTIRPQKSSKGQRVYSKRDVERLLFVKDLLKNQGFTIAGAKRRLREPQGAASGAPVDTTSAVASPGAALSAVGLTPARPSTIGPSALNSGATSLGSALSAAAPVGGQTTLAHEFARSFVPPQEGVGAADGRAMRRALLQVREELASWIREIEAGPAGRA